MRIIKTIHNIRELQKDNLLPQKYLKYIEKFFYQQYKVLADKETIENFSLEKYGYIVILESNDDVRDLRETGLNAQTGGLLGASPEYVELETLEDGTQIYKVAILYNNEYIMFFFSEVGQFDEEVESWLKEQVIVIEPISEDDEIGLF